MKICKYNEILGTVSSPQELFEFIRHKHIVDIKKMTPSLMGVFEEILSGFNSIGIVRLLRLIRSKYFCIKSKLSTEYWTIRGWDIADAKTKISKLQSGRGKMSLQYWLRKGYTKKEAQLLKEKFQNDSRKILIEKLNSDPKFKKEFSPHNPEFWIKRGYGEKEAAEKSAEQKTWKNTLQNYIGLYGEKNGSKRWEEFKKNSGFSLKKFEAKYGKKEGKKKYESLCKKVSYSYEKCVALYGLEDGLLKWSQYLTKAREKGSLKWYVEKYGEKEGHIRHKEKCKTIAYSHTLEYLTKKYGKNEGKKRYINWMEQLKSRNRMASKYSLRVFIPLYKYLRKNGIGRDDIFFGISGSQEWFLGDKEKFYVYDFVVKSKKVILEFNGEHVHPNPVWKSSDYNRWDSWRHPWTKEAADVKSSFDEEKNRFATKKGFKVIVLWLEDGEDKNIEIAKEAFA